MKKLIRDWLFSGEALPETKTEDVNRSGFFSTDMVTRRKTTSFDMARVITKSFQKTVSDFTIEELAMDSAANLGDSVKGRYGSGMQGIPDTQMSWYASQGFIGYQACAMLAQNWLIDKACSMTGEDAVRNGYEVTIDNGEEADPELIDMFRIADEKHNIQFELEQYVRYGRIFGIRHALFLVESSDPEYYTKPFNPDGVVRGSYKGISQIDPYWITPELDAAAAADPASKHFYEPTFWRISGQRYHRSHFIIMRNGAVPDVLKPSYMYGGIPVPQRLYERVYAAERTANEAPQLLLTKRTTTIHTDVEKVMADQAKFEERIGEWIYYRDNYGVKVLGKEEVMEQFDTSLTDMDEAIMTQFQLVAAIAGVPATKLMGTSPKGFNATGEYEESSYHETLEGVQKHSCAPFLRRHHLLLMRSEIAPKLGLTPIDTNIKWCPLDTPTAKEQAEVNLLKAQVGNALVTSGAIDGMDERDRVTVDKNSGYSGLPAIEQLEEPLDNGDEETPPTDDESETDVGGPVQT